MSHRNAVGRFSFQSFRRATLSLLAAVALWQSVPEAGVAQSGPPVVELAVEGNRVTSGSLILGVAAIDRGSSLSATGLQDAMQRLYALGIFSSVRIEAEEVNGGLRLFIIVREYPKLGSLEFVGAEQIKPKSLREKLGLGVGGYISPYLIFQKQQEIRKQYADKGFFQAVVTPEVRYADDSSEAFVTYRIAEGSKVKVEQVIVQGNQQVPASALIGKMRNRKRGFLLSSTYAQDKYEEDLQKVVAAYHKRGFIDAYLIDDSIAIDSSTNRMTIHLRVYEGQQYYFGDVTFTGDSAMPERALTRAMKFSRWDVFDAEKYEKSLYEIYTSYQEIGHLHAGVLDEKKTRSDSIIDVAYTISEGLPSKVNLVRIVGNTKTKEHVIRREISILPGQVFNRSLLIRSVRDVMALNFFANVEPVPIDLPSGDVDIEFKIEEKQTGQVSAGAGYNSEDKLVGNVGMGIPNLFGYGQNLTFSVEFGGRRNSLSLSFTEPWLLGRPTLLGADVFSVNRRVFDDYTERRQGGSVRVGRRLSWPDRYFRISTAYRLERNKLFDFSDDFVAENSFKTFYADLVLDTLGNPVGTKNDTFLVRSPFPGSALTYNEEYQIASRIGFTISRDSRNLPEFATKGSQIAYTFENTGGVLGGFWRYRRHSLSAAKFIPIVGPVALAARVQYGVVTSPRGDDRVLLSDRFTPGGTGFDGIVRGYDDGDLTPDSVVTTSDTTFYYRDSNAVIGSPADSFSVSTSTFLTRVRGNYQLVANFELQTPLIARQIYALAFFDAGNSWLRLNNVKPITDLYASYGFGFRVIVPGIGTIGFDFGRPLREFRSDGLKWKPHFQLGTTFR